MSGNEDSLFNFGSLPDEILVEVFRMISPVELLTSTCLSCHRFLNLIESEFLYQHHHFVFLLGDFLSPSLRKRKEKEDLSWKQFTKKNFMLTRFKWIYGKELEKFVVCEESSGFKTLEVIESKRIKFESWGNKHSVCSSVFVDPKESHEWVIQIQCPKKDGCCNCWFFLDDDKSDGRFRYLYQIDGKSFFYNHGGIDCIRVPRDLKSCSFASLLDDNRSLIIKIRLVEGKFEVEVKTKDTPKEKSEIQKCYCVFKKSDMDSKFRLGVLGLTMNIISKMKLISFKKIKNLKKIT